MQKAKMLNLQIKYNFKLKTNSTRSQNITKGSFINYVTQRRGKFFQDPRAQVRDEVGANKC